MEAFHSLSFSLTKRSLRCTRMYSRAQYNIGDTFHVTQIIKICIMRRSILQCIVSPLKEISRDMIDVRYFSLLLVHL